MLVWFVVLTEYFDVTKAFYWCVVISYQFFVDKLFFFIFWKPSASSFSGKILRNVETGRVFPCAPLSIFRRNLWTLFRFGNLMLMSTKAPSFWVILIQLNVRLFICSSASLLLYTASFSYIVFSYIVVDCQIFFLCSLLCDLGLCFRFVPFDKHTDALWVCFTTCVAFWSECWTSFTVKSMSFTTFEYKYMFCFNTVKCQSSSILNK